MSQKTEIVCDRCGKDILHPMMRDYYSNHTAKEYSAKITLWGVGEPRSSFGQRIDLCPECYEKFVNFMEGGAE